MMSDSKSILSRRKSDKDCFACRLVSGAGVLGMGAYIGHFANKRPTGAGRNAMYGLAGAVGFIGIARLFHLYPFKKENADDL